jgi:hypothetical protein
MKINKRIFNLSAWLALLTIILIPGKEGALRTEFGYPFRFLIQYHNESIESKIWFIRGVNIQLLLFLFNVLIIYGLIHVVLYLNTKVNLTRSKR